MIDIVDVKERGLKGQYQARGISGHAFMFHISNRDFNGHLHNTQ